MTVRESVTLECARCGAEASTPRVYCSYNKEVYALPPGWWQARADYGPYESSEFDLLCSRECAEQFFAKPTKP